MAEWNLSVQLTGQGTDLVNTLRRSSSAARKLKKDVDDARQAIDRLRSAARQDIEIGVTVDARNLRSEVTSAVAGAGGHNIAVRLSVDGNHLRDEVNDALTAAAAGQGLGVDLTIRDSMQLRRDVADAVRWASMGHRILIPIGLDDPMQLRRDVSNAVRWASMNHNITIPVSLNTGNAVTQLTQLTGGLNSSSGAAAELGGNITGLAALATALVPIAASAVPLAASMGAAAASVGAFGIALAGQVGALGEAADAQTKLDDAVRDHGATSKEAAEAQKALQAQLAAMPAPTREASAALSSLKDQYHDWSDALAADTMPVAVKSFQTLGAFLPRLTPMVQGAARQMDRLVTITAGGIQTDSFDRLFDGFSDFANGSLDRVTDGFVHLLRVLSGDAPAGSAELRAFMEYAKSVGPQVAATLKDLGRALLNIMESAAQMGVSVLTVVDAVAKLIAAVPSGALTAFFTLALALKAVQLATMGLSAGGAVVAAFATQLGAARAAAAGAGGPLAAAAAGFMALSRAAKAAVIGTGIGVLLIALTQIAEIGQEAPPDIDRLTTSLGKFARTGKIGGEAARVFGKDLGTLEESLRTLARPSNREGVQQFLTKLIGMDSTPVARAKEDLDGLDKALAGLVKNGNPQLAEAAFRRVAKSMGNLTPKELRAQLDDYKSALADAAFEQELAAESMGLFGQQAISTSEKLAAQKASADGLRQSIQALNDVNRAGMGGMIGFEAAIDAAAKAAQENAGALTMSGGQLNLNSEKARNAATALTDLAAKTDEAAGSARESGASWETVSGIYARGRDQLISSAQAMGLTKGQAEALAASILKIPDSKKTKIQMEREDAIAGLNAVQAKIKATPGSKSVTVKALTASAIQALESLGFKVTHMKDGSVTVSVPTGGPRASISAIQGAINSLRGKTVTNTIRTNYVTINSPVARGKNGVPLFRKDGGTVDYYADGGVQRGGVRHFAGGAERHVAQFAPAGTWRVWAEPETGGEAYIPLAPSKRRRSRDITEETVRRLGGKGVAWNANGSITQFASGGFNYNPASSQRSISDVQSSYSDAHQPISKTDYNKKIRARANAVDSLRAAEAKLSALRRRKHTHAQLVSAENSVAKARRSVATATEAASIAQSRYNKTFSLTSWQKTLQSAVSANASWEANLNKIASRGAGADVIDQLRDMGKDGAAMVSALAKASNKQFADIVANLRRLAPIAKATLADYTSQLNASTKTSTAFQANLAKIASMGYGDLAMQLAGQGDEAAQRIAAEAAGSSAKAQAANTSAKNAAKTLSGEELSQLVQIIAAVKSSGTGIHDVAAATGLGEDDIVTVATKAASQITSSLGSRGTRFMSDLARAQKGLAYANGGIRSGIYATRGGAVTFAEPSTGGEAYIPLGAQKRRAATNVLGDVAGRFGLGLTPANAGQVVVIREQGPLVGNQTFHVTGGNAVDTARQVESRSSYQLRRLARGGAAAR